MNDKLDFKPKLIKREKEYHILIRGTLNQKDIATKILQFICIKC
jgi:hypothetical protein